MTIQTPLQRYGTLGPACQEEETLLRLFQAGMTGVRLNLSHVDLDGCGPWLEHLWEAARRAGVDHPQLLVDLRGPELRVDQLAQPVALAEGETVLLGEGGIPVPPIVLPSLHRGQQVLLDDGALLLEAEAPAEGGVACRVIRGGTLRPRKSIALPGAGLRPPTLTPSDLRNLSLAVSCGVTGVMLPFVRDEEDLLTLRRALEEAGGGQIRVFAKLENREGVAMLPRLLPHADEIVIARGDLGNDLPLWELPAVQKEVAALCRQAGKPFMVVTQMLHSMHHSAVPTRAEVSDIFNAVLDGASSIMLTGETAAGDYPVEAMTYLCKTADCALAYQERHRGEGETR